MGGLGIIIFAGIGLAGIVGMGAGAAFGAMTKKKHATLIGAAVGLPVGLAGFYGYYRLKEVLFKRKSEADRADFFAAQARECAADPLLVTCDLAKKCQAVVDAMNLPGGQSPEMNLLPTECQTIHCPSGQTNPEGRTDWWAKKTCTFVLGRK